MILTAKNSRLVFTLNKSESERFRKTAEDLAMLGRMGLEQATAASEAINKALEAVSASQQEPAAE